MALSQSALFLAFVSTALAGPLMVNDITTNKCASSCPADSLKFGYEVGKTYHYDYKSEVITHIQGSNTEKSKLNVQAVAQVEVLSPCEMLLKLMDVELTDSHPERLTTKTNVERAWEFKRALQQRSLRFAFKDGQVEAVCPHAEEETWALNVKRAILSGLQNTMHDLGTHTRNKESDISGDCYVDYSVESLWSGYKITKVKDVLSCSGRAHYDPFLQTTKFGSNSRIQSLPLIKTTHQCEQTINNAKIITATRCQEKHVFRPFSTQNSGATTEVAFSLEYTQTTSNSRTPQGKILDRKSLVFEYEPTEHQSEGPNPRGVNEVKTLLTTICQQTNTNIDREAPATYAELVRKMRQLSPDQLSSAHTQVKASPACPRAEDFFQDAVPLLGTPASVRLMRTMLTSGELTGMEADKWLTSMSFVTRPTRALLADVKELLVQNISIRKSTLAVTSLVNNYCHLNADCGDHMEVRAIIRHLDDALGYNCAFRNKLEYNKIMTALKGIGNAGHAERVVPKLNRCILNRDLPIELRVTAVTAFRRMACTAEREELLNAFLSTQQDAELRLAAYLGLMACPTTDILSRVHRRLETEEVNQVGSFVWTHLTNLQTTASPLKQDIRKILENQELKKTFDLDKRKFSRNVEWSTFSESLNAGVTVDSNLIWSPKSFMPRSASVNLTVDMFGESLNLIEVGGRAEGIDNLLEDLFGPNKEVNNHIPNFGRNRRSATKPTNMDPLHNRFGLERDTPKGSYYMRMFGNEINFDDFQEFNTGDIFSKLDITQVLEKLARQHNIDHTRSGVLFDTAMVVPTVAGFPLRLQADGTSVMNVKAQGKMDVRRLLSANPAIDIEGTVRPSAAVQVKAEMAVDATMARSGVRMVNTIRSNTLFAGRVEARNGGIFNLDINLPDDSIELFDATSKFFIDYRDTPREQAMLTAGRIEKRACTNSAVVRLSGLELCARFSAPHAFKVASAPHYPLTGPSTISLVLNKRDTYRGMHFETKFAKEEVAGIPGTKDTIKISFSTPGSRVDREFTFEYVLDNPKKAVSINLKTPIKTLGLEGSLVNTPQIKEVNVSGSIDSDVYSLLARVNIAENRFNTQFRPLLEVSIPNRPTYRMNGNLLYRAQKKAVVNLNLQNIVEGPLTVKGSVDFNRGTRSYETALAVESTAIDAKITGTVINPRKLSTKTDVQVEYTMAGENKHTMRHKLEWNLASVKPKFEFILKSEFESSAWSNYDSDLDFSVAADKNDGQLKLIGGLKSSPKRVTFETTYSKSLGGKSKTGEAAVMFALPHMNWNHRIQGDFQIERALFKANMQRRSSGAVSNLKVHLARQSVSPLRALLEVSLDAPGRHHLLKNTITESTPGTYDHQMKLDLSQTYKIRMVSTLKKLPHPEINVDLTIPNKDPIKLEGFVNPDFTDFRSSAKFEYGSKVYSTGATWRLSKVRSTLTTQATFELVYPDRTVQVETKSSSTRTGASSELSVLWDATKDPTKAFKTKVDAIYNTESPRFTMRADWYDNKFINLAVTAKRDLSWPERSLEAEFNLLSSFESAPRVSLSIDHKQTRAVTTLQYDLSWGSNQKINTIVTATKRNGWKDAKIIVQTTTPFEGFKTAKYENDYSIRGSTYEVKNRVEWDGKFVEVDMTAKGDIPNRNFEGDLALRTSYEGYSRMSVTGKHNDNGQIFNSQLHGTWRDGSVVTIATTGNWERNGQYVTTNGDLTVSLPVGPYKTSKLAWNHKNDAKTLKSHIDLELDSEKTVWDLESTIQEELNLFSYELKTIFTSPYSPVNDLGFNLRQTHNPQTLEGILSTASVKWAQGKTITFENKIDIRPSASYKLETEVTTPFENYEKLSVKCDDQIIGDKYQMSREWKWGPSKTIKLDGFVMMTFPETSAEFVLTTPFEITKRILTKFENKKERSGIWKTQLQVDYPEAKKIEISTEVGLELTKKLKLEIKTPYTPLQTFLIDFDHEGQAQAFKTKIQVAHNLMGGRAIAILDSDVSDLEDAKILFTFRSPYESVPFIKSEFTHKLTGNTYRTAYTLEYPGYKSSLSNVFIFRNFNNIIETFVIEYGDQKIETGFKFKTNPFLVFTVFLKTPYEGYTSNELEIQYDGRENTIVKTAVTYGNSRRLGLDINYRNNGGNPAVIIDIRTPFEGYETMRLTDEHQGKWNNFKNVGTLVIGDDTYNINAEFQYRANKIKMEGSLTTPHEAYRTISMSFNHDGVPLDMKQDMEFKYGDNEIRIIHEFKFKNQRLTHKLFIVTPFAAMSSLRSEIKHNGPWKNFKNEGTLEYNGREYSGITQFVYGKKAVRGSITVKSPEVYKVRFNHKGEMDSFTNNIQADFNGEQYNANTQFKLTGRNIEASTSVQTPHPRLRSMTATFKHRGPLSNFRSEFDLNINDNTYTGEANLRVTGNTITGKGELKLPEVYSIDISHSGPINNFENSLDISIDGTEYELQSSYKKTPRGISGAASLKIPQEYSITFEHTGRSRNFANHINLVAGLKEASGKTNFKYVNNELVAGAGLKLPITGYEKFDAEIKHNGDSNRFKTEGTLDMPFTKVKKLFFEVDHRANLPEFNTKASIGYNRKSYGFGISHEGNRNDFTTKGNLEYSNQKTEAEVKWKQTGTYPSINHEGSIRMTTPYRYLKSVETKLTHSISDTVFNGQLESLYNDETYFDTEYTFTNNAKKSLTLIMREPRSSSMNVNYERTESSIEADTTVNWDTTNSDSNVKVSLAAKNSPKYEFEVNVIRATQTSMFKTDLEYNRNSFNHGTTVQWGRGDNKKAMYTVAGMRNIGGRRKVHQGSVRVRSPFQNMVATVEHERTSRSVKTVMEIGNIEKLTIIHEFLMREPEFRSFKSDLIMKHPQLQQDIKFMLSGLFKPRPMNSFYLETRANLEFANDEIVFESKLGDASTPDETKYLAWAKINYPRVGLDSQALVEGTGRDDTLSGQIKLDHMTANDGQWRTVHFISTINKQDRTMNIEAKSPYHEDVYVRVVGRPGVQSGVYNVDVNGRMGTRTMTAELALDKNAPLMDFKLNYKPDHHFHMYAKYLSSSTVQFEANRRIAGAKILESQFAVRLNNSRLIHARAYFRPEVVSEIQAYMAGDHGVQTFVDNLKTAISTEMNSYSLKMQARFRPLMTFFRNLAATIDNVFSGARRAYIAAYNRDQYYLKTSHHFIKRNHAAVSNFATAQYNKYKPMMDIHFANVAENWEQAKARMQEQRRITHAKFVSHAKNSYNNLVISMRNCKENFIEFLNAPWFSNMAAEYAKYKTQAENWFKDTIDSVRTHRYVAPVIEWGTSLPEREYFIPIRNFHRDVKNHFDRMGQNLRTTYSQAHSHFSETFDTEEMEKVQAWLQDRFKETKDAYTYYGLEDVENYLRDLSASNLDELKAKALTALKNYVKPEKTRVTVWDLPLGDFQVEIYLPVHLRNIRDFPTEEAHRLMKRMRNTIDRLTPDDDWIPWDTIYAYRVTTEPRDWIPPFKSHATIAGSQHYMTFDKKFYEFSGECSYVLAHDFIDGNFSVVVNYDTVDSRMTKKSITVLSSGKEIEIFPSFKVTVDRKQTELPVEFADTSVLRQGNRIRLDSAKGVTVLCDLAYDRCTVNVTGWYFAKTAGMLGTYNNEQYDEMLTAERRITSRPEMLADSWTVGSKCRAVNNARISRPETESSVRPICAKYFQDQSSPFRLCFRQIDVKPFMTMCLNELSEKANQVLSEEDMCKVSAFYVDECNRVGVALRQPRACVSCERIDGHRFSESNDQKLTDDDVPQSADVVFVVSQKPCNAQVIPKLQKLLSTLEDSLSDTKSLRRNRYGVVGFGGDGTQSTPHSHTIEGQLFNRNLKVGKMIGDLQIASDDSGIETAIDALDMAARYPFRAGVSKTIVLLTCQTCSENLVSYADMVELLLKRDIKLHLITPHDFRMKTNSPKANNIWGMTRYTVYTNKHANKLEGDVTLRRQTYMPKDLCGALAHETEGAIFNAKKFGDRKIKDFRTVISSVVANVATPSACQVCECVPDETGLGQPVCHNCNHRMPLFGLLPKFDDYLETHFMDTTVVKDEIKKPKPAGKNKSRNPRRRRKN